MVLRVCLPKLRASVPIYAIAVCAAALIFNFASSGFIPREESDAVVLVIASCSFDCVSKFSEIVKSLYTEIASCATIVVM